MIFLAGPTAVGKSEVALFLAERLGGEIISVDSMQVYRGMDIGTAKPSPEDRARIPHHLIDVVDITESFDAAQFVRLAQAAVKIIEDRGHVPIFCGGTGLYFKAFLEGLGDAPPADASLRSALEKVPLDELLAELEAKDPKTFQRIDRQNPRRVIRAVEVIRLTGRPFSEQRSPWGQPAAPNARTCSPSPLNGERGENAPSAPPLFALRRHRDDLHHRIDARVEAMFRQGLVAETEALLQRGLEKNKVATQALGYRQVIDHLKKGIPLHETIKLAKLRTRQFAKRQMTWFRRQLSPEWLDISPSEMPTHTTEQLLARLSRLES